MTAERAYRLDFGLSRCARRGYSRDRMPPETGSTKATSGTTPGEPRSRRQFRPRQRNPVAAAVTGNRPASPGDIADQRQGLNPGHDERHSPRRCITVLSPTAALQSVPGTSAAQHRIKPRTHPAGSTAGRHLRRQPAGTNKTIIGSRHDQPVAATQRNPKNAEEQGLSGSRQAETRGRRPNAPTASISAFPGTSAGITRATEHGLRQAADTKTTSGATPGEPAADGNFNPGSGTR